MSEKILNQPGIGSFVRQHVSRRVPQHVRMHMEADTSVLGGSLDNPCHHVRRQHATPLRDEDEWAVAGLLKPPQASNFIPIQRMHAVVAALDAENVYCLVPWRVEVEMCPFDVSCLSRAQAVTIHQPKQDLIAQALTTNFPGSVNQAVCLRRCQVIPIHTNMRSFATRTIQRHLSNSASQADFHAVSGTNMRSMTYKSACFNHNLATKTGASLSFKAKHCAAAAYRWKRDKRCDASRNLSLTELTKL